MSAIIRLYSRAGWEPGPWDDEPDLIFEPPILLYRQPNGAWAGMVAIEERDRDAASEFITKQGAVKLDCRELRLDLMCFDSASKGAEYLDTSKLYVGFTLDAPGDARPHATRYVRELPPSLREEFMEDVRANYITAQRAKIYAGLLARVLNNNKISVVDCAA